MSSITEFCLAMLLDNGEGGGGGEKTRNIKDKCVKAWRIDGTDIFVGIGVGYQSSYSGGCGNIDFNYTISENVPFDNFHDCQLTCTSMWGIVENGEASKIYSLRDNFGDTAVTYALSQDFSGEEPTYFKSDFEFTETEWLKSPFPVCDSKEIKIPFGYKINYRFVYEINYAGDKIYHEERHTASDSWGSVFSWNWGEEYFKFADLCYRSVNFADIDLANKLKNQLYGKDVVTFSEIPIASDIYTDKLFGGAFPEPNWNEV